MYVEQSETELSYDANNPVEREVYQIFLNIWENGKAFLEYWATQPLSRPQGKIKVRTQSPRKRKQSQGRRKARAGKKLHLGMSQRTRKETPLRTC